jgi:hypothetical protein
MPTPTLRPSRATRAYHTLPTYHALSQLGTSSSPTDHISWRLGGSVSCSSSRPGVWCWWGPSLVEPRFARAASPVAPAAWAGGAERGWGGKGV